MLWLLEYLRKASLVVVVVFAQTHLWLQMQVLILSCLMMVIGAGYIDARTSRFDKLMDNFNEVKLVFIMYHMVLFTDFVPAPETQNKIGFSCAAALVFGTAVNMLMLVLTPVK